VQNLGKGKENVFNTFSSGKGNKMRICAGFWWIGWFHSLVNSSTLWFCCTVESVLF